MQRFALLLVLFFSCSLAQYATYYVNSEGGSSSNPGTSSLPFASLSDAISATKLSGYSSLYAIVYPGMYTGASNIGLNIDIDVVIAPDDSPVQQEVVFNCENSPVALTTSQAFSIVGRHNIPTRVQFVGCKTAVQFNGNLQTPLYFQNTDFIDFEASAINSTSAQSVHITDCTFGTSIGEGAIAINTTSLQSEIVSEFILQNSDFTGAGVFAKNYLLGTVIDVMFSNISSSNAALNVLNSGDGKWNIFSLTAVNCVSSGNGGALQLRFMDTAYVTASTFSGCMAANGGAIAASTNLGVVESRFDDCVAQDLGGAIYANGGEYFFKASTFNTCEAQFGAGIDLEGNILESGYEGLVFNNNYAQNGTSISCCQLQKHCKLSSVDEFQISSIGGHGVGVSVDCPALENKQN